MNEIRRYACEAPLGCSITRGACLFGEFYEAQVGDASYWTFTYAEALAWCESRVTPLEIERAEGEGMVCDPRHVCHGCLREIDAGRCHCGEPIVSDQHWHGTPFPLGCICGYSNLEIIT